MLSQVTSHGSNTTFHVFDKEHHKARREAYNFLIQLANKGGLEMKGLLLHFSLEKMNAGAPRYFTETKLAAQNLRPVSLALLPLTFSEAPFSAKRCASFLPIKRPPRLLYYASFELSLTKC